jgi:hypothetical protein
VKTLRNIALTYLVLLVLTLFALLIVPKAYSAYPTRTAPIVIRAPAAAEKPIRSTSSCRALVEEMNEMKKAQYQIISSLARNHDTFADQLSDLSFELALYKKTVPTKALEAMEKSAQAYRIRAHKAEETAVKLDDSTSDLIERIQRCLK